MVITQRLWSASISRSRRKTPSIFIAATIASTFDLSRPSEKFGTHSTRVCIREKHIRLVGLSQRRRTTQSSNRRDRRELTEYAEKCERKNLTTEARSFIEERHRGEHR